MLGRPCIGELTGGHQDQGLLVTPIMIGFTVPPGYQVVKREAVRQARSGATYQPSGNRRRVFCNWLLFGWCTQVLVWTAQTALPPQR